MKTRIGTTMSDMQPDDPLAMKDIVAKRSWMINQAHLAKLIDLGLVEMRHDMPVLTVAGQNHFGVRPNDPRADHTTLFQGRQTQLGGSLGWLFGGWDPSTRLLARYQVPTDQEKFASL